MAFDKHHHNAHSVTKMKVLVCTVNFMAGYALLGLSMFTPAILMMIEKKHHPHLPPNDLTSLVSRLKSIQDSISALLVFLLLPAVGAFSDYIGRKRVLIFCLISMFLSTLSLLAAHYYSLILFMYIAKVVGVGGQASMFLASAYMHDISTPDSKVRDFGYVGASMSLALVIAPLSFSFLGMLHNIDVTFLCMAICVGFSFLDMLIIIFFLPESLHYRNSNSNTHYTPINNDNTAVKGSINDNETDTSPSPQQKKKTVWERVNPFSTWGCVIRKDNMFLTLLTVAYVCHGLALSDVIDTAILYTNFRYHWTTQKYGYLMAYVGGLMTLFQALLLGPLSRKIGARRVFVLTLLAGVCSRIVYAFASIQWLYIIAATIAVPTMATSPVLQAIVSGIVSAEEMGAAISALGSIFSLCQFVGAIMMENIFAYFISSKAIIFFPGAHFLLSSFIFLIGTILSTVLFYKYRATGKSYLRTVYASETTPILSPDKERNII